MTALYVSYTLETLDNPCSLAIDLQHQEVERTPTHEILRGLDHSVDTWNESHPEVFVRSDLSVKPEAGAVQRSLSDYLYVGGAVNGSRLGRHLSMLLEDGRIHTFRLLPGARVEGRDLVGRSPALKTLREALGCGSVHLAAPRRHGKTSVLRQLKKTLHEQGDACLYLDVSPGTSASWFLVELVQEAMEDDRCRPALLTLPELDDWPDPGVGTKQRSLAGRRLEEHLSSNVQSTGQRILTALGTVGTILLVDEFSVFLRQALDQNREETRMISKILKQARQAPQPTRQVLAGSAGLRSFLHFSQLTDAFTDLEDVKLQPLAADEAAVLTEELFYGVGGPHARLIPSPEVVDQVLSEVGDPIPFFLHALVDAVREKAEVDGRLDAEVVRRAYREGLLGSRGNHYFKEYKIVHQSYPKNLHRAAGALLRELADYPGGISMERLRQIFSETGAPSDHFDPLLSCLQEDYDLTEQDDARWIMRSKVLRDRWSQREPWLTGGEP